MSRSKATRGRPFPNVHSVGVSRAPGEEPLHSRVEGEELGSVVLVGPVRVPVWVIATVEHHGPHPLGKEVGVHRADKAAERPTVKRQLPFAEGLAKQVDVASDVAGADIRQQVARVLQAGSVELLRLPNRTPERGPGRRPTQRTRNGPGVLRVVPALQLPAQPHPADVESEDIEPVTQLRRQSRVAVADERDTGVSRAARLKQQRSHPASRIRRLPPDHRQRDRPFARSTIIERHLRRRALEYRPRSQPTPAPGWRVPRPATPYRRLYRHRQEDCREPGQGRSPPSKRAGPRIVVPRSSLRNVGPYFDQRKITPRTPSGGLTSRNITGLRGTQRFSATADAAGEDPLFSPADCPENGVSDQVCREETDHG